jgi:aphidicolan-16beta-ol synthase/syn-copalyl-diphosphate synthase
MDEMSAVKVRALIYQLYQDFNQEYGYGSMSCTVYDTAWLAQISKLDGNVRIWLFPECFHYVLQNQQPDGSWPSYADEIDTILNTAASLLALQLHLAEPLQMSEVTFGNLTSRIAAGKTAFQKLLSQWDVESTDHVGFEVILPSLLQRLEKTGLSFGFPGKVRLLQVQSQKLRKFKPHSLYGDAKLTALHSLEAFIGMVDFDKVRHHKAFGSMMSSPSSTAAYLMNVSEWDPEAELYLRHVISAGPGRGSGGVPSAFPSTYFEYCWTLSTLLKSGFQPLDLGSEHLEGLAEILQNALKQSNGTLGFGTSFAISIFVAPDN